MIGDKRELRLARRRQLYRENPHRRLQSNAYRNTEHGKELRKEYAKRRKHVIIAYRKKDYEKNGDKIRTKVRKWYYDNHGRARSYFATKKAMERSATIGDLTEISKIYERCEWWRKWFDVVVDHIIPFAKGGTHEPSNLQIIYAFENLHKHARLNYKPRVIFV